MKTTLCSLTCSCLTLAVTGLLQAADPAPNILTPAEKAAGWKLLFDGQTLAGWRNVKKTAITSTNGWVVEDGWLKKPAKVRGGDIITVEEYENFDLSWEWRLPRRANNGVKYFFTEKREKLVGHEYQMIDDSLVKAPKGRTGSFYEVLPPQDHKPLHFAPESNHSRIVVQGNRVEHWLNGEKILAYECGSPEVKAGVARSKFRDVAGFGEKLKGHILLTDHGDECSFRNLKIRELPAK